MSFWEKHKTFLIKIGAAVAVMMLAEVFVAGHFRSKAHDAMQRYRQTMTQLANHEDLERTIQEERHAIRQREGVLAPLRERIVYRPEAPYVLGDDIEDAKLHYTSIREKTREALGKEAQSQGVRVFPYPLGFSDDIPDDESLIAVLLVKLSVVNQLVRTALANGAGAIHALTLQENRPGPVLADPSFQFVDQGVALEGVFPLDDAMRFLHGIQTGEGFHGRFLSIQGVSLEPSGQGEIKLKVQVCAVTRVKAQAVADVNPPRQPGKPKKRRAY